MKRRNTLVAPTSLRGDLLKFACVFLMLAALGALFLANPALSGPTLIAIVFAALLSPMIGELERRGMGRTQALVTIFMVFGAFVIALGVLLTQSIVDEWESLVHFTPFYFKKGVAQLHEIEKQWQARYSFLSSVNPTEALTREVENTGRWLLKHTPALMGQVLSWALIVPVLTFVILKEGSSFRQRIFAMVPNRFFESSFIVTSRVIHSLTNYISAKLVEAAFVGFITMAGLMLVHAPYAIVLGMIAGVTNILPYIGPFLGAAPGILIATFDPGMSELLVPMIVVYVAANVIDTVYIFPVIVGKLVNLNPLILVAVVMLGQQYYGLIGMLISIPIAAAIKVIAQEIYYVVYNRPAHRVVEPSSRPERVTLISKG